MYMNLNITELDNEYQNDAFNYNDDSYWEKKPSPQIPKKKVTFDDILCNMNLVVNKEGILQFMTPKSQPISEQINDQNKTIDPELKHSYIFNKYFKEYNNQQIDQPVARVPKTIEEYNQMILDDKIKAIHQKRMIDQIKSKKMLYTSTSDMTVNRPTIKPSINRLKMMNFH